MFTRAALNLSDIHARQAAHMQEPGPSSRATTAQPFCILVIIPPLGAIAVA